MTEKIHWDKSISVYDNRLDDQHKFLINLFNLLIENDFTDDQDYLLNLVDELLNYVETHLRDEEEVMKKIKFPDIDIHTQLHHSFERCLKNLKSQAVEGKMTLKGVEMSKVMEDWFYNHIKTKDQEYVKYLKNMKG